MKKVYLCSDFDSILNDFMYAYSPNCREYVTFHREADAVVNGHSEALNDYDYVSMVTKERFGPGTKVTTHCSFEKFGAPLIVFSDDIAPDSEGRPTYDLHFEAVAFEEGCNVWRICKAEAGAARPIKTQKIGFTRFPIEDNSVIEISVLFEKGKITVTVNGVDLTLESEEFPEYCHVGFTACEGINRFYDYIIETPE